MNALRGYLLGIVFALSFSAMCCAQDIALDFQQVLDTLRESPVRARQSPHYYDMEDAVNAFTARHGGPAAVEFIEERIEEPCFRKLALLSLAKLAATNAAAENALYGAVSGNSPVISVDAITAVAYTDPENGRRLAEAFLTRPGPWQVRRTAADMLIGLGDRNTLEKLRQMQQEEEDAAVRKSLESPISQLEYRLTQIPVNKQAEWARQETLLWRTPREGPRTRSSLGCVFWAATVLRNQGEQFSAEFLEYKLKQRDPLAIAMIGSQKEAWAVEGLKQHAVLPTGLGDIARDALANIGTSEALRALESSIIPTGHSRANTQIMMLLQDHGDEVSAEFMKNLSMDERFSDGERMSLSYVYRAIRTRLCGISGRSRHAESR